MHHRIVARQSAVDRLKNKTGVGPRVYRSRSGRFTPANLPAINVLTPIEEAEKLSEGEPQFRSELDLVIQIVAEEKENYDDIVDNLADEVESILFTDPTWVKIFEKIVSVSTRAFYRDDGESPIAGLEIVIKLQFTITYSPIVEDALTTIHADWDVPPHGNVTPPLPAQNPDAEDEVSLPE